MKFNNYYLKEDEATKDAFQDMMSATGTQSPTSDLRWARGKTELYPIVEKLTDKIYTIQRLLVEIEQIYKNDYKNVFGWADKIQEELDDKINKSTATDDDIDLFDRAISITMIIDFLNDSSKRIGSKLNQYRQEQQK
jgi:hypothetical protein